MTNNVSKARLEEMAEEATVDAYDESEQATGWFTMVEEHLDLPFDTKVLGVDVIVEKIGLSDRHDVTVVCRPRQGAPLFAHPRIAASLTATIGLGTDRRVPPLGERMEIGAHGNGSVMPQRPGARQLGAPPSQRVVLG